MFTRYWIVAVAFGLTLLANQTWSQAATENEPRQEESATATENDSSENQPGSPDITSALEKIEAAIRDLIAEEDKIAAEAQKSRESRDLKAQEGMAHWAKWMFFATFATVVLTFAALAAIIRTLHHTRRAADSADQMLVESQHATSAASRAWLTIKPKRFEIIIERDGGIGVCVDCLLANEGKSPAFDIGTDFLAVAQADNMAINKGDLVRNFAAECWAAEKLPKSTRMAMPGDEYERSACPSVAFFDHEEPSEYELTVIICTSYRVVYDPNIHQTVCVFDISRGAQHHTSDLGQKVIPSEGWATSGGFVS